MTTPDKPLRVSFEVEVPGTPAQVWDAIASADGISSWFLPTELEPREGGAVLMHMGDTSSPARITGWEPERRLVYEEPEWATLVGHPGADVTPLTTEFLIEARSGGTCVVRVTSSAFGTGADWEGEFFDEMVTFYRPSFDLLANYVKRFPGQRATRRELTIPAADGLAAEQIVPAVARSLGVAGPGEAVAADSELGLSGTVLRAEGPYLMVETDAPVPGYVSVLGGDFGGSDGKPVIQLIAWLFGPEAEEFAAKSEDRWTDWLGGLGSAAR